MELLRHIDIALAGISWWYQPYTLRYGCKKEGIYTTKDDILVVCLNITGEVNVCLVFVRWFSLHVHKRFTATTKRYYTVSVGMFITVEITFCIMKNYTFVAENRKWFFYFSLFYNIILFTLSMFEIRNFYNFIPTLESYISSRHSINWIKIKEIERNIKLIFFVSKSVVTALQMS